MILIITDLGISLALLYLFEVYRLILLKLKMDSRFPPTPSSYAKATEDRRLRRTGCGNDYNCYEVG